MSAPDVGPAPTPPALTHFVLKVHSRCDLACDHCYMYEHADQSWRARPMAMTSEIVGRAAERIAEHARARDLAAVRVTLHGGEPLLMGVDRLRDTVVELRTVIEPVASLAIMIQTNGVLLDERLCELFVELGVGVGVSLDGDEVANDRHRLFRSGASSHAAVRQALTLLRQPRFHASYAGLLCTVDIRNDPIRVYEALLAEEPPWIDLLLPHATWQQPPYRPEGLATPYADWLGRIYQRWLSDGRPVRIGTFDAALSSTVGGTAVEALGSEPSGVAVIETDGAWEQSDSMKTAYDGAPATGLNVRTHSADQVTARLNNTGPGGIAGLCATCRACKVVSQCGGGLYAHRYDPASGFHNPSVYCADLKGLLTMINQQRPAALDDIPAEIFDELAAGYGSAASVRYLADTQLGIRRALLVETAHGATGLAAQGWDLLCRLDVEAPAAMRAVLLHPYLRTWAVRCIDDAGADRDQLARLAAAAAIRAGVPVDIDVPIRDGQAHLPTLGTVRLRSATGQARISVRDDHFVVAGGGERLTIRPDVPADGWQPVRRAATDGLDVLIEDGDPYRDCYEWPVADRLDDAAMAGWNSSLAAAVRLVEQETPAALPGLVLGLNAVTPLRDNPQRPLRSATARHAFGSLAATTVGPADLSVMLVHEFQHSKLGAVLDVVNLLDPANRQRLRVAWREDSRPVEGVLQGIYAHFAVADTWRARAGGDDARAADNFAWYRDATFAAIEALRSSDALTVAGTRFVARLSDAMETWR